MQFTVVLSAADTLKKVSDFIYGDGLVESLRIMTASDDLDAAILALSMDSNSPKDRIKSAISHLERAYISNRKVYIASLEAESLSRLKKTLSLTGRAMNNCLMISCLLTLCYVDLRDKRGAKSSLALGDQIVNDIEKLDKLIDDEEAPETYLELFFQSFSLLSSTDNWKAIFSDKPLISRTEYREFSNKISKLVRK